MQVELSEEALHCGCASFIHSILSFLGKSYFGIMYHNFQAILITLIKFNFLQANIIIIIIKKALIFHSFSER